MPTESPYLGIAKNRIILPFVGNSVLFMVLIPVYCLVPDKMEQQNISTPDNLTSHSELTGSLDIKIEPDVNLTNQDNFMVKIKVEDQAIEQTNEINLFSDPNCGLGNIQVKQETPMEIAMDNHEINHKNTEADSVETNIDTSDNENNTIVAKEEQPDHEAHADVKKEMSMSEDSLVSYDYPSFDDSVSMDSNDVAAFGNVETCLQEEIHIKPESLDATEVSMVIFCRK